MSGSLPVPLQDAPTPGTADVLGSFAGVPLIVIYDAQVVRGQPAHFSVRVLDGDGDETTALHFQTGNSSATAGSDYTAQSVNHSLVAGVYDFQVATSGAAQEEDEEFTVTISLVDPANDNAFIARSVAVGRILGTGNIHVYDAGVYDAGVYD